MVDIRDDFVSGNGLTNLEEEVVQKFLTASREETRTLADIILDKLNDKEREVASADATAEQYTHIPSKVADVYGAVGKLLAHYKSGKLPKALKMLPHLKNWEHVLWLTRPDTWSAAATFACTRIFASNLNEKMAQRFFNIVLLEKCRDDIRTNNKLNYYLYMALKKALYKPAAFYKGLLLPLAMSHSCTLREATIIGSVVGKVSIPGNHSAAVLLKLAEMPYSGSTSLFIKVLLMKKYALPRRVLDALTQHFCSFENEARVLPVSIWNFEII
jgi:essential nuclear protein 1